MAEDEYRGLVRPSPRRGGPRKLTATLREITDKRTPESLLVRDEFEEVLSELVDRVHPKLRPKLSEEQFYLIHAVYRFWLRHAYDDLLRQRGL